MNSIVYTQYQVLDLHFADTPLRKNDTWIFFFVKLLLLFKISSKYFTKFLRSQFNDLKTLFPRIARMNVVRRNYDKIELLKMR